MSDRIYMDNAATSFPKPPAVMEAMAAFAADCGASAGRGAYGEAVECGQIISLCRRRVASLINAESPERIVFAMNCSEALAIVIRGLLNTAPRGSEAVATAMEHNSVLRPLNALAQQTGLLPKFVPCDGATGMVDPDDIRRAMTPRTALIVCQHASNVTGTLQPIAEVAAVAAQEGVPCLIDAAQSAGQVAIDVQALGADFVAFPGHKGLLGPLGTGVLYIRPGMEDSLPTMKEGGTGTVSERPTQPTSMPDKYEIGSHNAIGLAGLSEGVAWLLERGLDNLREHHSRLGRVFAELTNGAENLTVYGPRRADDRVALFSVNVGGMEPGELAAALESSFGVLTRAGLHCAPLAHRTIGTYPLGTCRLSFGPFTDEEQVRQAASALVSIAERVATGGSQRRAPVGG